MTDTTQTFDVSDPSRIWLGENIAEPEIRADSTPLMQSAETNVVNTNSMSDQEPEIYRR